MGPENQDVLDKPNVTIGFSVNGATPRVFHVPLTRFSWVVTLVLALLTWSAIATALLFYRTWDADTGVIPVAANQVDAAPVAPQPKAREVSKAVPAAPNWKLITVREEEDKPFLFADGFAISQVKLRRAGSQRFELSFNLANTDGELREGNIWALARFTDGEGHFVDVLSSDAAGIQKDGTALDSRQGSRFAIRNHKARELDLNGAVPDGMRLQKLAIGLRFLAEPEQKVLAFKNFTIE